MLSKVMLTAAVIGAATAQIPEMAKRDFLENRQLDGADGVPDGVSPECQSAISDLMPLYSEAPTPPADLLSVTLPTDPCVTPTFTGKLESEWTSYTSAAYAWYNSHSNEFSSFIAVCSDVASDVATGIPVCSTELGGLTSATSVPAQTTSESGSSSPSSPTSSGATTKPSSSAGSSSSSHPSSGSPSSTGTPVATPNAAPRETSLVVAVGVAAAALMGAVAVL
ncbi:hypothetical protein F5Y19DRAFT_144289 [Xylariaceae sp. FL1651]|nr:hypothetical protein F5Y19DRAFT_144289 [Xylariaceae sp. FL1651]